MQLSLSQSEAISAYTRALRILDNGADSEEEFYKQQDECEVARNHCLKLGIPAELGIAYQRMIAK